MYLLDTNHCSLIIENHPKILQKITEIGESKIFTCDVVRGELIFMAYNSKRKKENLERMNAFLKDIGIYFIDEEVTNIYGELKALIFAHFGPKEINKRRKVKIGKLGFSDNDIWIAATALRNNLIVVSEDSDFKRMCEVKTIPWECWK